ncbi:MAG: HNH endonuclease signature motif containing protein [Vulcanimicrobiaceae bacterium]
MDKTSIVTILQQIEDKLFPQLALDVHERVMYYFVFRHTVVIEQPEMRMSIPQIAAATDMSDTKARETVRSLAKKGCIKNEVGKDGYRVEIVLPAVLVDVVDRAPAEEIIDIETIDFYTGRRYVVPLLERQDNKCFYCRKEVTANVCVLDHVKPLAHGGDNSFRNIVASCHECNSLKKDAEATDFMRTLYRRGILNQDDLFGRIMILDDLREGRLRLHSMSATSTRLCAVRDCEDSAGEH